MAFCTQCGQQLGVEHNFCSSCGAEIASSVPPNKDVSAPKQPRLSFPPSGDEYPEDFGDAADIWNGWTVWQRRIWNEAGRPDLLTYPGTEFEEWIIDNAKEDFDFDSFVTDFASRESSSDQIPAEQKNKTAPWALGFGIASVFLFEFLIPMLAAIPLGIVGIRRASDLKRAQAAKTGFAQSLIGLVLGIVYTFQLIFVALGFGP